MPYLDNGVMCTIYGHDENLDDVMRVENSSANSELALILDENGDEVDFLTAFNFLGLNSHFTDGEDTPNTNC